MSRYRPVFDCIMYSHTIRKPEIKHYPLPGFDVDLGQHRTPNNTEKDNILRAESIQLKRFLYFFIIVYCRNMTHPNNQFSAGSENNKSSPYYPQDNVVSSVPSHDRQESSTSSTAPNNAYYVQSHNLVPNFQLQQTVINTHVQASSSNNIQIQIDHPIAFFFQPPSDFYHYYVNCKEISYDTIAYLLTKTFKNSKERNIQFKENEYIFVYRQRYDQFYQISCEIVSPLLVNNCLNKNFLGIELQQDAAQENLSFTSDQKENLEYHLKQYLSQYLLN
ncbi:hypothetical protein C1645_805241 [Glomus cerebriforme]|uniref:Uncharacterized protein n=1 Tax=Glomus cerebriforme TaxID=658196 RepID=A0A397SYS0_9GLOM|nr:hypothetical protein C1645_805241 [Glomus cerebriforme]